MTFNMISLPVSELCLFLAHLLYLTIGTISLTLTSNILLLLNQASGSLTQGQIKES